MSCNAGGFFHHSPKVFGEGKELEKVMATPSSILAWRILMDRGAWRATVHGVAKELDMTEQLNNNGVPDPKDGGDGPASQEVELVPATETACRAGRSEPQAGARGTHNMGLGSSPG